MKAIFTDMDGTLLRNDHLVSKRTADTLKRISDLGNKIVLASGRAYDGMRGNLERLGFRPLMATLNGAYIIDEDRNEIFSSPFRPEDLITISRVIKSHGLSYMFFYGEHWGAEEKNDFYEHELSVIGIPGLVKQLEDMAGINDVHKIIAVGTPEMVSSSFSAIRKELSGFSVAKSSPYYIEINNAGVNKGLALETIAERYGIDRKDTIAFGDYDNDIEMLEKAGVGVAMANSTENVLERTALRTESNEDDGVAVFLESYFSL